MGSLTRRLGQGERVSTNTQLNTEPAACTAPHAPHSPLDEGEAARPKPIDPQIGYSEGRPSAQNSRPKQCVAWVVCHRLNYQDPLLPGLRDPAHGNNTRCPDR
ncbi:hypothetical protein ABMA28_003153 [Loxostege sticticalis]|uniref:Uncharacterized protein n=1 Tax=Loxostege sticticalis TaxID=481309 RepID=A0ABD0SV64_LOXSC